MKNEDLTFETAKAVDHKVDRNNKKLTVTTLQKLLQAVAGTLKRFSEEAAFSYLSHS